jgi:hypothetical protein
MENSTKQGRKHPCKLKKVERGDIMGRDMNYEAVVKKVTSKYYELLEEMPYWDIGKAEEDFKIKEGYLYSDLAVYIMDISDCARAIKDQDMEEIKDSSRVPWHKNFFDVYPEYKEIEKKLDKYPDLKKELEVHEEVRELIQKYYRFRNVRKWLE